MTKVLLSVDPGTSKSGYSYYRPPKMETGKPQLVLSMYGVIHVPRKFGANAVQRGTFMCDGFMRLIGMTNPQVLVVEFPQYMGGTKGRAAAMKGDTLTLAWLIGRYHQLWDVYCRGRNLLTKDFNPTDVIYIKPSQWKGNLNKEQTQSRLLMAMPDLELKKSDHDVSDAIALGKWFIEKKLPSIELIGAAGAIRNDLIASPVTPEGKGKE